MYLASTWFGGSIQSLWRIHSLLNIIESVSDSLGKVSGDLLVLKRMTTFVFKLNALL